MIQDAEEKGLIREGIEIVEPTSEIRYCFGLRVRTQGYRLTLTMPDTMSIERRKILKMLGANLTLTDGSKECAAQCKRRRTDRS